MGIFSRKKDDGIDRLPPNTCHGSHSRLPEPTFIKKISLVNSRDFTILRQNLLDGHIMVVDLEHLIEQSQVQQGTGSIVHNQLQLIKQYCIQNGGSVLKLKQHLLMITPNRKYKINPNN